MPNRVLLVDDSDRIRKSVRAYLEKEFRFHVCGELADVHDAIEKVRDLKPDLIVLEVSVGNRINASTEENTSSYPDNFVHRL
jgi:two-component system nitrate/nitrite response regulator NarL